MKIPSGNERLSVLPGYRDRRILADAPKQGIGFVFATAPEA
jgi:hypothetical protein